MAPGRLDGKVCIVTGGTSGIGRYTVELFVQEGAKVLFCGRGETVGEQIAARNGEMCVFLKADVTKEDDIKTLIDKAVELWGKIDCLFNNAGGNVGKFSIESADTSVLRSNMQLNFESMCLCIKYALPYLKKQEHASIISNSSVAAKRPGYGTALYSATKSAMDAYSRVAAQELAKYGIRVNMISPGAIATPIFWGGSPGSDRGKTLSQKDNQIRLKKVQNNIIKNVTPLRIGRAGSGYDIASAAVFLASDESVWITGQDFVIDGGMSVFDAPNKGWMADDKAVDPVPFRKLSKI
mmetsp:Transcript_20540/g.24897  ORF Transcript_20540/g.24897 Transcript_20540/m.24897 type:complete len:295 (-) Transcript_20540:1109-1993(-)|eukprot:CAMPEP_0204830532 /NCGR_PEP_ID=MMETSP1346-20131115/8787_1 /ASSEMBLY_ACC=CAM_ASM_000771 /TAXON_ID=215587 /ORGANISM="Aplanochytrium stocchinoi, Strain GSBS06" /LENGTH=294 /DNA_ID=CAMNT_0051960879 /DNA_START=168 /DNA_END=1052 /DNA_ORIENTATION=-